jgi:putative endopeptidase
MTRRFLTPLALSAGLALAIGCSQQPAQSQTASPPSGSAATAGPAFDVTELDTSVSACSDLNAFVNAKWLKANPIPEDRTSWGTFDVLTEKSLNDQRTIAEDAGKSASQARPGSIERKVGDLYKSGMDEATIDKLGFDPIKPKLASIAALKTPADVVAWLDHSFAQGDQHVFAFGSGADFKNAKMQIATTFQAGLGLPTPDYYSKPDYKDLRAAYAAHIAKLFELTGVPAADATRKAASVLAFETALAGHSLPPVELRKPENQYHFVTVAQANAITPHFDWSVFFRTQGVDPGKGFSLPQPAFFAQVDRMIASTPIATWKDYLSFHVIDDGAPYLSQPFQDENFAFNGKTLNGQPEQQPRWKRVLGTVNSTMGEGLGQLYVARFFPPEAKARAKELVDNVRNALKARIQNVDWMSDETKQKALAKWEKFLPKIGYPDTWRDWSGLSITPDQYYANVMAGWKFNYEYDIAKIGKPTDRLEWGMTPQTINAYYNPTDNTINFPAAILQPPFFYANGDDAINYGGIGAAIGHESSHGFDDEGSQFDGDGNNLNWWTKADRAQFDARTDKLVKQFDAYAPLPDQPDKHVNGQLTLGENIADLGGLNVAYDALQAALKAHPEEAAQKIDGYTEDQRFFLNWARVWRGNVREKRELVLLNINPHAPAQFRAIGAPSNMPSFAQAFQCKPGDPMVRPPDQRVKIW